MIITNKNKLPQALVDACKEEETFGENTFRVTQLLKGYKEIILSIRHKEDITKDVSEMAWLIFGTAVHSVCEKGQETDTEFKEERLTAKIGKFNVTGKFDLFDAKKGWISDYKTATVWKMIYEDFSDWGKQLATYAVLLKENGFNANGGTIIAFLKDFSKSKAKFTSNYPQCPVVTKDFEFTDFIIETYKKELEKKLENIDKYLTWEDDEIPQCTAKERWAKPTTYAVMKTGRKTALKVCESEEEARKYMIEKGGTHIEIREGGNPKCEEYCDVCQWCNFYKENVEK